MAEVFLALQLSTHGFEKLVVVKRILPSKSQNPTFVDMFLREARIAAPLTHPSIVQTFDAGELEGTYFIAMEYVEGEDLRTILRAVQDDGKDALPIEHAMHVALGVCSGLAYVHEKRDLNGAELGIVHGDISARNLIVSFTGDVKVVDFGIATSDVDGATEPQQSPPKRRQIKGKTRYMSPEQAAGKPLDARTDIFSLGVVLFELTTGQRLLQAGSDIAQLRSMHASEYPRPSDVAPDYSPALERIVLRALKKDRAERYPSAREMQAELEEFIRHERIAVSQVATFEWMRSLFAEKLAGQNVRTIAMRERAAAMGEQRDREARTTYNVLPPSAAGGLVESVPPHAMSVGSSPKWRRGIIAVVAAAFSCVLGVAVTFLYMQHTTSLRVAEALKEYRDEQALRLAAPPPAPNGGGRLEVVTMPEECTIWIDGVERPEKSPATLDQLALERDVHIKLVKEGFEPYRANVKLTRDAPFTVIEALMLKLSAAIVLLADPHVSFNLWLDGKLRKDHSKIDGLSPDEEHVLGFYSGGFLPKTVRVILQPGETKELEVNLVRAPAEP
jgi:serine/threonine protein kinase